jgi:hypothetical protein
MNASLALMLAFGISAPAIKPPKKEPSSIHGEWKIIRMEYDQQTFTPGDYTFQFNSDGTFSITLLKDPAGKGTYKVDYSKSPFEIEISAPERGRKIVGNFKLRMKN